MKIKSVSIPSPAHSKTSSKMFAKCINLRKGENPNKPIRCRPITKSATILTKEVSLPNGVKQGPPIIFRHEEPKLFGPIRGMILRPKPQPLQGHWTCNYHVKTVSELTLDQADRLLHLTPVMIPKGVIISRNGDRWYEQDYIFPEYFTFTISYPVSKALKLTIKPMVVKGYRTKRTFSAGYFLWSVAQGYKKVYKEYKKYGVWGHVMSDLYFESIDVQGKTVTLGIGS